MHKELQLRRTMKKRKPHFSVDDVNSRKRLRNRNSWRAPRGSDSKMRVQKKGHKPLPSRGYSSPRMVRGLNRQGLQEVIISNLFDLQEDFSGKIAVISHSVGAKKRIQLLHALQEKNIAISLKDAAAVLSHLTQNFEARKKEHKQKKSIREKAKEENLKKKEKDQKEKKEEHSHEGHTHHDHTHIEEAEVVKKKEDGSQK